MHLPWGGKTEICMFTWISFGTGLRQSHMQSLSSVASQSAPSHYHLLARAHTVRFPNDLCNMSLDPITAFKHHHCASMADEHSGRVTWKQASQ